MKIKESIWPSSLGPSNHRSKAEKISDIPNRRLPTLNNSNPTEVKAPTYRQPTVVTSKSYTAESSIRKTRGCLSYITRKPNIVSSRAYTVEPSGYSSWIATRAHTAAPSLSRGYNGYYSRTSFTRNQDCKPRTSWYNPSRFLPSYWSVRSSFFRFRSKFF